MTQPSRVATTSFTTWNQAGGMMRITMKSTTAWAILNANGPLAKWLRGEQRPDAFAMDWLRANAKSIRIVSNHDSTDSLQMVRL